MNKLVRDKIPDLIRAQGAQPNTHTADTAEYRKALASKLSEETREFLTSRDPAEIADILEVLHAIAAEYGFSWDGIEQLRQDKRQQRGGFEGRIIWKGNR